MNSLQNLNAQGASLSVLVVDDRLDEKRGATTNRQQLESLKCELPGLELFTADNLVDAQTHLYEQFVSVIIADHSLGKGLFGSEILEVTRAVRPSAYRVIMTTMPQYGKEGSERFFECFEFPDENSLDALGGPRAHQYLPLDRTSLIEYIRALVTTQGRPCLAIEVLAEGGEYEELTEQVFDQTIKRRLRHPTDAPVQPKLGELAHSLRSIFAMPRIPGASSTLWSEALAESDAVASVRMYPLTGGRSSSTVLACRPITQAGHECGLCVIKVSPRGETIEEVARYHQYARLHRAAARRIELLGSCISDTLGAAAYSFAGGGVESVATLDSLFESEDARALHYLRAEFSPTHREWYSHVSTETGFRTLVNFFQSCYGFKPADYNRQVFECTMSIDSDAGEVDSPGLLSVLNSMEYSSCIVHGDLNSGNILCGVPKDDLKPIDIATHCAEAEKLATDWLGSLDGASNPRTILIDYRHTRRGPLYLDFAALQASLRLMPVALQEVNGPAALHSIFEWERGVWNVGWEYGIAKAPSEGDIRQLRYLGVMSASLIRLARMNFDDESWLSEHALDPATARSEYCATCILYALRLLKIRRLGTDIIQGDSGDYEDYSEQARLRLSLWIRQLAEKLMEFSG